MVSQFSSSPNAALFCPSRGNDLVVVEKSGFRSHLNLLQRRWRGSEPEYSNDVLPFNDRMVSPDGERIVEHTWSFGPNGKPHRDELLIQSSRGDIIARVPPLPNAESRYTQDGRYLFRVWSDAESGPQGSTHLSVLNMAAGAEQRWSIPGNAQFLQPHRDGRTIAYFDPRTKAVIVYDLELARTKFSIDFPEAIPEFSQFNFTFNENADKLAILFRQDLGVFSSRIEIVSLRGLQPTSQFMLMHPFELLSGKRSLNSTLLISPTQDYVVAVPGYGRMDLFDFITNAPIASIPFDPDYFVSRLAFCRGDSYLATQDTNGRGVVWDLDQLLPERNDRGFNAAWNDLADAGAKGFSSMRFLSASSNYRDQLSKSLESERSVRSQPRIWNDVRETLDGYVAKMGSGNYRVRDEATRSLGTQVSNLSDSMARTAYTYLLERTKDVPDPEARRRVEDRLNRIVLPRIRKEDPVSVRILRAESVLSKVRTR